RRRRQRAARRVVDDLGEDVPGRSRDDETRTCRRTVHLLADAQVPTRSRGATQGRCFRCAHRLLSCLSGLAPDDFALVAHALALVGLGLADLADVGGGLADLLLVDARDDEPGRGLDRERDAVRRRYDDGVAEAEGELQVAALGLHAVAGADYLERLGVALRHALHHVGDERAGEAVPRLGVALVVRAGNVERAVL